MNINVEYPNLPSHSLTLWDPWTFFLQFLHLIFVRLGPRSKLLIKFNYCFVQSCFALTDDQVFQSFSLFCFVSCYCFTVQLDPVLLLVVLESAIFFLLIGCLLSSSFRGGLFFRALSNIDLKF